MEKEQKKLLLVAVSVGVFLLVTITAAIVIMTPKAGIEETAFSSSRPYQTGTLAVQPPIIEGPIVIHQPSAIHETNVNIDCDEENIAIGVDRDDSGNLTINIPRPTTAAVPDPEGPPVSAARPVVTVAPRQQEPAARPVAPAAQTAQPAPARPAPAPAAARPAPAPAAARQSPARTTNDFWVQTGAFSAKVRADDAKELLASKGITSIVENRQIDGKTWYRVRLGPYTSQREADYWLALVRSIDGFGESQVRQTARQ